MFCNEFDANNNYSVLPLQSVYIAGGAIGPGAFGVLPKAYVGHLRQQHNQYRISGISWLRGAKSRHSRNLH